MRLRAAHWATERWPKGAQLRDAALPIMRQLADENGVTIPALIGRTRCKPMNKLRAELYGRLRDAGFSYPQIGHVCERDQSTVLLVLRHHRPHTQPAWRDHAPDRPADLPQALCWGCAGVKQVRHLTSDAKGSAAPCVVCGEMTTRRFNLAATAA